MSSTGAKNRFKEMTTATSGVIARFAQSERQLSCTNKTQDKKDHDLPCRLFIGNGVSISRQEERFWKARGKIWNVVCNKGLRDALLPGPKTFVLCNRKPSYSVLWSVLGVARSYVRMKHALVAPTLERRQPCNALFSLIVVLNRNTLAPSTIRSTERGR